MNEKMYWGDLSYIADTEENGYYVLGDKVLEPYRSLHSIKHSVYNKTVKFIADYNPMLVLSVPTFLNEVDNLISMLSSVSSEFYYDKHQLLSDLEFITKDITGRYPINEYPEKWF